MLAWYCPHPSTGHGYRLLGTAHIQSQAMAIDWPWVLPTTESPSALASYLCFLFQVQPAHKCRAKKNKEGSLGGVRVPVADMANPPPRQSRSKKSFCRNSFAKHRYQKAVADKSLNEPLRQSKGYRVFGGSEGLLRLCQQNGSVRLRGRMPDSSRSPPRQSTDLF